MSSTIYFNLDQPKILSSCNGLLRVCTALSMTPSKSSPNNVSIKPISPRNRTIQGVELSFEMQKSSKTAKSFGLCQPARIAQADIGRYFSQML